MLGSLAGRYITDNDLVYTMALPMVSKSVILSSPLTDVAVIKSNFNNNMVSSLLITFQLLYPLQQLAPNLVVCPSSSLNVLPIQQSTLLSFLLIQDDYTCIIP